MFSFFKLSSLSTVVQELPVLLQSSISCLFKYSFKSNSNKSNSSVTAYNFPVALSAALSIGLFICTRTFSSSVSGLNVYILPVSSMIRKTSKKLSLIISFTVPANISTLNGVSSWPFHSLIVLLAAVMK